MLIMLCVRVREWDPTKDCCRWQWITFQRQRESSLQNILEIKRSVTLSGDHRTHLLRRNEFLVTTLSIKQLIMERYPRSSRWIKARSERCDFWLVHSTAKWFCTVSQITTIQRIFNNLGIDSMGTFVSII